MLPILLALTMALPQDTILPRWHPLARYLDSSLARRAFPGAVVAVGRRDSLLFLLAVGRLDYRDGAPVTPRTVYDLASLTKVVGLTTAAMMLVTESPPAANAGT